MSDHTQTVEIAKRLNKSVDVIENTADEVGVAIQVKELASDRRKNLLARYMNPYLLESKSAAVAEYLARNNEDYINEFNEQALQLESACVTIKKADAKEKRYEANRSLLSASKNIRDDLMG